MGKQSCGCSSKLPVTTDPTYNYLVVQYTSMWSTPEDQVKKEIELRSNSSLSAGLLLPLPFWASVADNEIVQKIRHLSEHRPKSLWQLCAWESFLVVSNIPMNPKPCLNASIADHNAPVSILHTLNCWIITQSKHVVLFQSFSLLNMLFLAAFLRFENLLQAKAQEWASWTNPLCMQLSTEHEKTAICFDQASVNGSFVSLCGNDPQ